MRPVLIYDGLNRELARRGLTKTKLAAEIGISSRTMAKIEKGERLSPRTLERIAAYLGVDAATLMQEVADNLAVIEAELALKEIELSETQQALDETEALCEQQYYAMKQRIKFMYESSDTMYIDLLVSSGSFGEFLNYSDYIEDLEEYDRMMLETYQQTLQTISENKALLEQQLADIQALDDAAVEDVLQAAEQGTAQ